MENGLSAADVALLGGNHYDGFGGGSFMWIFGLLILMGMFNGGFGWGGNGNVATQNDVQRGFDSLNLQDQSRDILGAVTAGTAQSVAATNQTFHDTLSVLTDKYGELARDIAAVQVGQANALANQNQCCCETKMQIADSAASINAGIAQNRYDAAMNTAAINATTTEQTQKILDALQQNKIEALQGRINQLELQNAVAGVVRYPTSTNYSVPSPCFTGCGCGVA